MSARCLPLLLAIVCALPGGALADDNDDGERPDISLSGAARFGWRFLRDDEDGRFRQDVNLRGGPRLFDFDVRLLDHRDDAPFDEISGEAHDAGERSSDYGLVLRRGDTLRVEGGYARDLYSYRASGDPFPYDTTRERAHARLRYAASRGVTLRLGWDRSERRGDAFASADIDTREVPPPAGVDENLVRDRRGLLQRFDTFTVGADVAIDDLRFGLTESVRGGLVDDERLYDVPPARRGADPVRELLRRTVRSRSYTTVAKAGGSFLDGDLVATLFLTHVRLPAEADVRGDRQGFDNDFSVSGGVKGAFESSLGGETELDRSTNAWRLEAAAQPAEDIEIVVSAGQDETVDEADLVFVERRRFARPDVAREITETRLEGRTTNRTDRASLEVLWDAAEDVRLRGGRESYSQDLEAPLETRRGRLDAAEVRGRTYRWILGADVQPARDLRVSALWRRSDESEPHATASVRDADEAVLRARWRALSDVSLSGVYRYRGFHGGERFDSVSRVESLSLAGALARGPLTLEASVTRQTLDSRADTSFLVLDPAGFRRRLGEVTFRSRDLIVSGHAEYAVSGTLRVRAGGTATKSGGSFALRAHEASLGLEHDAREDLTVGLTLRSWRYDERVHDRDDYDAEALEVSVELRF